jgi:hypothetical protein
MVMDNAAPLAELEAMRKLIEALSPLEPSSVGRVLRWAQEQYGVTPSESRGSFPGNSQHASAKAAPNFDHAISGAPELADFYSAIGPRIDAHKALVVAYWLQERTGVKGLDAQRVNTELKQLGHGVGNITRAFDALIRSKPQLVIQTKKSGTTQQARKLYKVTVEGRHFVETEMAHRHGKSEGTGD